MTASTAPVPTVRAEGTGWFPRGIHPVEEKLYSRYRPVMCIPAPDEVRIPLSQHAGAPAVLAVKPGEQVTLGQCIADAAGVVSAPLYAPFDAKVGRPVKVTLPNGRRVDAITLTRNKDLDDPGPRLWRELCSDARTFSSCLETPAHMVLEMIRSAGLVGMGGAAFPTAVKLSPPKDKPVRRLLINGCECEPYLTADDRLMREAPAAVLAGAVLAANVLNAGRIDIGVEDNKPEAIKALRTWRPDWPGRMRVRGLPAKYPMGGEKQLIRAVYDKVVPTGGLPMDVGVAVINVSTAAAIAHAVRFGRPLTHRVVSVTGPGITQPNNLWVPIGTGTDELIGFCQGLTGSAGRVLSGGPMMGMALNDLTVPVTKGSGGIVALRAQETRRPDETACLRCGRCVDACPLHLTPARLGQAVRHRRWDLASRENLMACMECGCCAYQCPAGIPLVQLMRTGKTELRKRAVPAGAA